MEKYSVKYNKRDKTAENEYNAILKNLSGLKKQGIC